MAVSQGRVEGKEEKRLKGIEGQKELPVLSGENGKRKGREDVKASLKANSYYADASDEEEAREYVGMARMSGKGIENNRKMSSNAH